ncbi:MAG TPA: LmeA family phospholipid-binding protein [Streptosporangiaceae bacterium]|nr:LmeA family phospholipid-binding protein [Streptosporangiaceae bacterium]
MNSDPNQAAREWWQRQENKDEPEEQGLQESQDSQATRQYPVNRNYQDPQATQRSPGGTGSQGHQDSQATRQYPVERGRPADQGYAGGQGFSAGSGGPAPATPTFTPRPGTADEDIPGQGARADSGFSAGQGYPSGQAFPSGPAFPSGAGAGYQAPAAGYQAPGAAYQAAGAGYQQDKEYPAAQGYQGPRGTQDYPPSQGFPPAQGYQAAAAPPARRRRRRWPWITLIVIIVLLIGADRAANAFAEDQMASQFQSSLELSGKPHVTIQGFPFLTQLAAQNLHQVDINASNETAGPGGQLAIKSLTATLHGLHIHGTNSATIDDFTASALVTFSALAHAGNIPGGITLSADGPNRVKAHVDLDIVSGDVILQVTQVGDSKINIKLVKANGLPTDLLGNLVNFTITIPKLPAGVKIQKISVTSEGLRVTAAGHNATLSQ